MTKNTLEQQLKKIAVELENKYPGMTQREAALGIFTKLSEETGELADEVLSALELQRKDKLAGYQKEDLRNEWKDVLIVLLLLAEKMDINYLEVLQEIKNGDI
jgi:NTP pyrophosphatase (non-canonical NTP hydrolase)